MTDAFRRAGRLEPAALVLLLLVGFAHALAVAPHYHVGSFDDDASYLEVARALAHGAGLTSTLPAGYPLAATYPPGYPALLAPLFLIFGGDLVAFRALSLALFLAVLALTWAWLRRSGVARWERLAVTGLVALNPVAGTYATMVMAEMPFLVVLLLLWRFAPTGRLGPGRLAVLARLAALAVAGAALIYLKEAAFGLVLGLGLWMILHRRPGAGLLARAGAGVAVVAGAFALYLPVVLARASVGATLIGSRYSSEIGGSVDHGGPVHVLLHVVPGAIGRYLTFAVPHTVMPLGHRATDLGGVLMATATPLVLLGLGSWAWRRRGDLPTVMTLVYLAETLVYPYINERRLILVLPLVLLWYAEGIRLLAAGVARLAAARARRRARPVDGRARRTAAVAAVVVAALVATPLAGQLDRDYLRRPGFSTSKPIGSSYLGLLRRLGRPSDVVETDFLWTVSYGTGHRTANTAAMATGPCDPAVIRAGLRRDHAAFVLTGALLYVQQVDTACMRDTLAAEPGAVRLLDTPADNATVYELIGPGSPRPRWYDAAPPGAAYQPVVASRGSAVATYLLPAPVPARQVSVGGVVAGNGDRVDGAVLEVRRAGGGWRRVATALAYSGHRRTAPLLATLGGDRIAAVRVITRGAGTLDMEDLHVLAAR